ncbi:MAG TPA: hypothetical protein VMS22_10205 [Candidatus Eisenbacteria bacterium]|nr:hypothetical protein [Candidatus Eisenbacteria bacterium]
MAVIIVGEEKNFAALRPRLFTGSVSTKAAGQVSAAIEAANPGVDLRKLVPGTVLSIPDGLPHVAVPGDLSVDAASKQAVSRILDTGAAGVAQLGADADVQATAAAAERKRLTSAFGTKAVKTAVRQEATVAAGVKAVQKALGASAADEKARQAALAQAEQEWSSELAALRSLLALE